MPPGLQPVPETQRRFNEDACLQTVPAFATGMSEGPPRDRFPDSRRFHLRPDRDHRRPHVYDCPRISTWHRPTTSLPPAPDPACQPFPRRGMTCSGLAPAMFSSATKSRHDHPSLRQRRSHLYPGGRSPAVNRAPAPRAWPFRTNIAVGIRPHRPRIQTLVALHHRPDRFHGRAYLHVLPHAHVATGNLYQACRPDTTRTAPFNRDAQPTQRSGNGAQCTTPPRSSVTITVANLTCRPASGADPPAVNENSISGHGFAAWRPTSRGRDRRAAPAYHVTSVGTTPALSSHGRRRL